MNWGQTDHPGIFKAEWKDAAGRKQVRYKVFYRDSAGKQRTKTFERIGKPEDGPTTARGFQRDIATKKATGIPVNPDLGKTPLKEVYNRFLAHPPKPLRPSTRARYETHWRLYIEPAFGDRAVASIQKAEVRVFLAELGKGAATVEAVHRLLARLFSFALADEYIFRHPMVGLTVETAQRRKARILDVAELRRLADEVAPRYSTLVMLLGLSGLRIGEATALKVKSLDLAAGTVHVVESAPEVNGHKLSEQPTKTRKSRTVDLPASLVVMLDAHLEHFGSKDDPASLVFTGPGGHAIRQNAWRKRVFQPAARRAGIEPIPTVHDLRHSAASLMSAAGYTLLEAAAQLGHGAVAMTAMYSDVFKSHREAKVSALDGLLNT